MKPATASQRYRNDDDMQLTGAASEEQPLTHALALVPPVRHAQELDDPHANIIFGSSFDESLNGKIRVSIVATGIADPEKK